MLGVLNKILVDFAHGGGHFNCHITNHRLINKLALLSILSTLVLSSLLLNPPVITNDEASATTGTAVIATPNLTLTNTNTSASIDIAALDPIGSFATSSSNDSATFTLTTNNTTGYTLSIAADDDNGSLLRPVDNPGDTPDSLESISSITTTSDFSARTQEAATSYNGKWGIRPSKYVDTNTTTTVDNTGDNPVYLPSPTASNPIILDKTTVANANNTENSYTIALGVRADHTIHAGTYSRTFKLLAVANPVSYSITFNQNTNDTVTNMPSTQSSDAITSTTVTLPSTVPVRAHYSFLGWCNLQPTTTNGIDSCTGTNPTTGAVATVYNPNGNGTNLTYGIDHTTTNNATLYAMWKIDTFTQTTEVRYENADGTWGSYNTVDTQTLNYGSSYSWSTAQITNFDSAAYQAASVSSYTVTEAHTNQVSIYRNTFTCTKQYRLQNADGTWGAYTTESTDTVRYGSSCSYSKTVTYYTTQSTSASNIASNQTLSLSLPRTTYTLTVSKGSNISSVSGGGTYRWGQAVTVSATKASNTTCISYGTPTWTKTAGTLSSTSGASVTFTMPQSNATVTATSTASNVAQTITLSRSGGASGINIGGTNYTGSSVSLTCGTYNISGNYSSGYEFSSWSRSGSVTVANASSASTTMTVSGPGTLTLAGKQSCTNTLPSGTGIMQTYSISASTLASVCPGATTTLTDNRDNTTYTIGKLADGKIWLLDNLALDLTNSTALNALSTSNTNASAASLTSLRSGNRAAGNQYANGALGNLTAGSSYSVARVNASYKNQTQPLAMGQSGTGKIGVYYNYCAASAGSYCYGDGTSGGTSSGNATEDICPKGWRMPTGGSSGEYQALYTAYSSNKAAFANALRTPLSGLFNNGSVNRQGSNGYFWSSTRFGSSGAYRLRVDKTSVDPQDFGNRHEGHSIRCILGS